MLRFAPYIADQWNLSNELSKEICRCWERGDTPFYLGEYHPDIATQISQDILWEIDSFLTQASALIPKQKRLINALRKANALTPELEERINLTTNSFELDDMLVPYRANPRSKAQLAVQKGLGELADRIMEQTEETMSVEELALPFAGTDPSLPTEEEVVSGVKDILVERFASDDTVRAMVREFGYDEGFFEVTPKKKGDREFSAYAGKFIYHRDLTSEEKLSLFTAEEEKRVRLKFGVQLFRVSELLRHHFIENPDSTAFDRICQAIDESWSRLLQPMVEADVKERIRTDAYEQVLRVIAQSLGDMAPGLHGGPFLSIGAFGTVCGIAAFDVEGRLLGASAVGNCAAEHDTAINRLRQFTLRHRPSHIIVAGTENRDDIQPVIKSLESMNPRPEIIHHTTGPNESKLADSPWMQTHFGDLDNAMRSALAVGLSQLRPPVLTTRIGLQFFPVHPLQNLVPAPRLTEIVNRRMIETGIGNGVVADKISESVLALFPGLTDELLKEIQKRCKASCSKEELKTIPGMPEAVWRNISGYLMVPTARNVLDRTLVHPEHFSWVEQLCKEAGISAEMLVQDPAIMRSMAITSSTEKMYIEQKLIAQLEAGQQHLMVSAAVTKRLRLNELEEDAVLSGRVTNITSFGVFVDINAVCDGLVHISQLADGYVETPEQVVSVGDRVNVRIVKIDAKKRRISLSMKGLGNLAPKVRPSQGQLSTLADHFKNR